MKPNCHSIVLLGCLFLAASCSRDWGTVNGRPLEEALVLLELNQVKAEVAAEFQSRFGVSDSPGFWATPLGGIKPESRAQDRAVEESAALMVDWELAFRAGLLAQPTYEDSRRRWAEENRQRGRVF